MDKQIIIDKSKCKHYWNGNCSDWDNKLIGACDDFEDCYCKMYLRKEQECEELKKQLTILDDEDVVVEITVKQFEEYKKLKAENDELKEELEELKEENEYNEANAIDFKQALTEIKEIAQVNSINTCWTAINLCADCDEIKECGLQSPFEKLKAIIQIISEVEDA